MPELFTSQILAAQKALQNASQLLSDELRAYPTPVSGCDAQYNFMIGERNRVRAALDQLEQPVFVATPRTPGPQSGIESR